jgi:hypothetical protein
VPFEGQQGVVAHHAAAVISDLDKLFAAGFDLNLDSGRTGVERILQQLLHYRRRPLYHLAGGNLVGNLFGKDVNAAHIVETVASFADDGEEGKAPSDLNEPALAA